METVNAAGGFTGANSVSGNSYATSVNDQTCGGPYASLNMLVQDNSNCGPPYFGWTFTATSMVNKLASGASWGEWQLPGGADAGRLLFATPGFSAPPILQRRGWELVRSDGANDNWVLENVTANPDAVTSAPPVSFTSTAWRLSHVTKQ